MSAIEDEPKGLEMKIKSFMEADATFADIELLFQDRPKFHAHLQQWEKENRRKNQRQTKTSAT